MKLKDLLDGIQYQLIQGDPELEITSIAYDSRKAAEGSLFVCLKGFETDGHQYIPQAVQAGAAALLVEEVPAELPDVTVVRVEDSRRALALLSAAWFGHPARRMTMIGLTGTKGKTTTAHMVKGILEEAGYKVGMIGTVGAFVGSERLPTKNTTPESYELHALFAHMLEAGCQCVVMEVSSQGLKLDRTAGIHFDYAAFLNLSPDHIGPGEHPDFQDYLACKSLLFRQCGTAVVNIDDPHWREVTAAASSPCTVSLRGPADFMARGIQNIWAPGLLGVTFQVSGRFEEMLTLNMPGAYNVENALIASGITWLMGVNPGVIKSALRKVRVKGRTQVLPSPPSGATFLIDYAHNALSMESLLQTLKQYHPKRLICLFGGGGNRARQRRFDMGEVAGKYADLTIITLDNPRFEDPESINADIIRGLEVHHGTYQIIMDREKAIQYLLDHCGRDDIAALIGKGHEEYQDIRGVKHFFSEEKVVLDYLKTK